MTIELRPATLAEANELVTLWHSHHRPVVSHKFSIAAETGGGLVGVVIVGRPIARLLDDGRTFEVTRLCTNGYPNAASRLLGAAWRAARAMGVRRMVSYTRADEVGTSYRAAGWEEVARVDAKNWKGYSDRARKQAFLPGLYVPSTEVIERVRWEVRA